MTSTAAPASMHHIAVSREFTYRGVPAGYRRARSMTAVYVGRVGIRAATADEAPVLCRIDQVHRTWKGGEEVELSTTTTVYRVFAGQVWARGLQENPIDIGAAAAGLIKHASTSDMHEEMARASLTRSLEELASFYLMVDGDIYEAASEPAIQLSHDTSFGGDSLTIKVTTDPKGQHVYRLDERAVLDADRDGYIEDHALCGRRRAADDSRDELVIYDDFSVRDLRPDLLRRPSINHHRTAARMEAVAARFADYQVANGLRHDLAAVCDRMDPTALPPGISADDLILCRDVIDRLYHAMRGNES